MNRPSPTEERIAAFLHEGPSSGPDDVLAAAHARARSTRQRPAWRLRLEGPTMESTLRARPLPGLVPLGLAFLLTLLVGAAFIAGSRLMGVPLLPDTRPALTLIPQGDDALFAFTSSDREGSPAEVYVARADGTDVRRITNDTLDDVAPAWSPDGGRIAVNSVDGDTVLLRVIGPDRIPLTLVSFKGCTTQPPAWSPDGRFIAYVATRDGTQGVCGPDLVDTMVVASDGSGGPHRLLPSGQYWYTSGPQWTDDGIVFSGDQGRRDSLYVAKVTDPSSPWGLTPTWVAGGGASQYGQPRWSPDGASIAVTAYPPSESGFGIAQTVGADGSDPTVLWPGSHLAILPDWSPDGSWLSVLVPRSTLVDDAVYQLGIVPADGSPGHLIETPDLSGNGGPALISPDGTRMLVRVPRGSDPGDILVVTTDGEVTTTLFAMGLGPVDWQPVVNADDPAANAPQGLPEP